eukprot:1007411-Prymnesium_polylepis.1
MLGTGRRARRGRGRRSPRRERRSDCCQRLITASHCHTRRRRVRATPSLVGRARAPGDAAALRA